MSAIRCQPTAHPRATLHRLFPVISLTLWAVQGFRLCALTYQPTDATMQAAPPSSYTSVDARHSLSRPPPTEKPSMWSPQVRAYVQRAFEADNMISGVSPTEMHERLRILITAAAEKGELGAVDWSTYPLPQNIIQAEREQAILHGEQTSVLANIGIGLAQRKRKSYDMDASETDQQPVMLSWKTKHNEAPMEDRMNAKSKKQQKKQKQQETKQDNFRGMPIETSLDVLEKRKQRFGQVISPEPSHSFAQNTRPEAEQGPLIGTCQDLEKSFFRLTAPPHPRTVRPPEILAKALDRITKHWKANHDYHYAWDQLKAVRQDLVVQHIKSELTVRAYETHARIALEKSDLGEYNQCQTQLRALHRMNLGGNPEEFLAYRILYFIYTCNRANMNDVLADLTPADKQKPGVQHALQVRSALASGNYHKFFRLYDDAPKMGGYLLDLIIDRERLAALAVICKSYKPEISLSFLANEIAFRSEDPEDPEHGSRQCLDFICRYEGGASLVERKGNDVRFLAGKAGNIFENARRSAFANVDIKGQI
nr:thp3 like c2a9.11c [Quercus suber]